MGYTLQAARYGTKLDHKRPLLEGFYCEHCKARFSATRRDAKYCSAECRINAHRAYKRSPEYLLKNRPYELNRYHLLDEISPTSAATVAKCFSNMGISWGLEVLVACLLATGQIKTINDKAHEMLQAACNVSEKGVK